MGKRSMKQYLFKSHKKLDNSLVLKNCKKQIVSRNLTKTGERNGWEKH